MKQKQKILAMIMTSLFFFEVVFAATGEVPETPNADQANFLGIRKSRSAKILDNFNERQHELLFESAPVTGEEEDLIFDSNNKMRSLEQILQRIQDRKNNLKERKKNVTKKKFDLKNQLDDLDQSIKETENSIQETADDIASKNKSISDLSLKIKDLDEKIANNKKTILNYLTYIYSKGEGMYDDSSDIDVVKSIVLNDGDIGNLLSDMHYKTLLELSGQNLVDIHRDLLKEYYYNKEEFKKDKLELIRLKNMLNKKNEDLESQKKYKEDLLQITKGQESLFNKFIIEKQKSESQVQEKIDNLETSYADIFNNIGNKYDCNIRFSTGGTMTEEDVDEIKDTPKCQEIKKYFELEKKLREDDSVDMNAANALIWPAEPKRGISTYFHDEEYYDQLGSEHPAIDIRYSQGTDLVAPAPGYVYFVSPPAPGKYAYFALKHANGFVTVYGHVSEILVNQFDYVEQGQLIAKSGGAPGTPGAGPMTSGPHLHFEVYKDRENVDPLRFLDVTALNYDSIGLKYKYKYIEDLKLKYGNKINMDRFQKVFIAGNDEIERQKYLLSKYANDSFDDWDMWTEEAINGQIDPSFLICVGLAETGLGKHLKTGFNVGNIGNTDSGGTYTMDSPRNGVYWMVKTLNNRYLSKYRSIDMLSRWGNKSGAIYASSAKNWHNNVVKCLSALKGRFVEDDYKFRLYDADE